jgi:nitrate/nitrite transporter NarK
MPSSRAAANLALATVAFALCFTAWSLFAPFAKTFEHDLGLASASDGEG